MWKVTLLFQANGQSGFPSAGWGETFYISAGSLSIAQALGLQLAQLRSPMLTTNCQIVGIRTTQLTTKGTSVTQFEQGIAGTWATPALPQLGVWVELLTAGGNKRQYIMRGIPQQYIVNQGWANPPTWNAEFVTYMSFLVSAGWQLYARVTANPYNLVNSVDTNGNVVMHDATANGLANAIKFFRTHTVAGVAVKKVYTLSGYTSPTVFQLNNWPAGQTIATGKACLYAKTGQAITAYQIQGVRKKNTGRVFFQLRGRSVKRQVVAA